MPFTGPGPGRPKGGLNRTTVEVREAARFIVDDPEYRVNLVERIMEGKAPHMETLLWHYAYGKPKETVELHGDLGIVNIFAQLTTEELLIRHKALVEAAASEQEVLEEATEREVVTK